MPRICAREQGSRLRGSSDRRAGAGDSSPAISRCPLCERGAEFHLHCMVCRAPMEFHRLKKTCAGDCKRIFRAHCRNARSVRIWLQTDGGPKRRVWVPRRSLKGMDTRVSRAFRAITAPQGGGKASGPKRGSKRA
jgi:predicted nucleic acid-binding Zn ribbon protein